MRCQPITDQPAEHPDYRLKKRLNINDPKDRASEYGTSFRQEHPVLLMPGRSQDYGEQLKKEGATVEDGKLANGCAPTSRPFWTRLKLPSQSGAKHTVISGGLSLSVLRRLPQGG